MKKGFTLIELLITIAVVGILSAIVIVGTSGQQAKARDAQRKLDIDQYRVALETYANANGFYPSYTNPTSLSAITLLGITSPGPEDPKHASNNSYFYTYLYQSNGAGSGAANATKYVIWDNLESVSNSYWVQTFDGLSGYAPSATTFSGGVCNGAACSTVISSTPPTH